VNGDNQTALDYFDAHVWCTGAGAPGGAGHAVIAWTNPGGNDVDLQLPSDLAVSSVVVFTMTNEPDTSTFDSMSSDQVYLNGALLTVDIETGLLPSYPIVGKNQPASESFVATAYSYGFVVFYQASPDACSVSKK